MTYEVAAVNDIYSACQLVLMFVLPGVPLQRLLEARPDWRRRVALRAVGARWGVPARQGR